MILVTTLYDRYSLRGRADKGRQHGKSHLTHAVIFAYTSYADC